MKDSSENDFKIEDIANYEFSDQNKNIINHSLSSIDNKELSSPIKLIDFTKKEFTLNPEALSILNSITDDIIIVSIVGKARTGKSYLMNLLLNSNTESTSQGFEVASSINSCTRGIWLWSTPLRQPNTNAKIIFIDSEGTNSVDLSTKTYDSKIFALVVLISSLFIYNTVGNIDEKSISELALAAHLSSSIATKSQIDKDSVITDLAPKFIWCLRDFTLDKVDPVTNEEISSDEYLDLCLRNKTSGKNSGDNNVIRDNIMKYFKVRECVTLPRPVDKEDDLKILNTISFDKLKPNFREEFMTLKRKIYIESQPKKVNGTKINGIKLAELLTMFVDAINKGAVPNISTAWDNIIKSDIERQYEQSRKFFNTTLDDIIANCDKITKTKRNSFTLLKSLDIKKNNILYDMYKAKYSALLSYNKVSYMNNDIVTNSGYNTLFKDYYTKLNNEIDREINRKYDTVIKSSMSSLKKIISQTTNVLDSKMFNDAYTNEDNYTMLTGDYVSSLNEIGNNAIFTSKDSFMSFAKNDLTATRDIIYYIVAHCKSDSSKKATSIETQIAQNDIEMKSYHTMQLRDINSTYMRRIALLNSDILRKEKEIYELTDRLSSLQKEKAKYKMNHKNALMMSLRKSKKVYYTNNENKMVIGTRTQMEGEDRGCECNLATCIIF